MFILIYYPYILLNRENTPAHDPFSIFEQFGFGGFGGQRRQQEEARTPNVEIPVRVTLRQLYLGEILDVSYLRQVVCTEANTCQKNNKDCQGPGVKIRMQQLAPGFVQQIQVSIVLYSGSILKFIFICCMSILNVFIYNNSI